MIEPRQRWQRFNDEIGNFNASWRPKKWDRRFRFVFIRTRVTQQRKGPVQFDLFVPHVYGYDFKVIVTNKTTGVYNVLAFHNGRGCQEGVFAELKSQAQAHYVPVRKRAGSQIHLLCVVLAHNLTRELQMETEPQERATTPKRMAWWPFEQLRTLRRKLLHHAGRLTSPQGRLTLTMGVNPAAKSDILHYVDHLTQAA